MARDMAIGKDIMCGRSEWREGCRAVEISSAKAVERGRRCCVLKPLKRSGERSAF